MMEMNSGVGGGTGEIWGFERWINRQKCGKTKTRDGHSTIHVARNAQHRKENVETG